jgi:hypothetical protein
LKTVQKASRDVCNSACAFCERTLVCSRKMLQLCSCPQCKPFSPSIFNIFFFHSYTFENFSCIDIIIFLFWSATLSLLLLFFITIFINIHNYRNQNFCQKQLIFLQRLINSTTCKSCNFFVY